VAYAAYTAPAAGALSVLIPTPPTTPPSGEVVKEGLEALVKNVTSSSSPPLPPETGSLNLTPLQPFYIEEYVSNNFVKLIVPFVGKDGCGFNLAVPINPPWILSAIRYPSRHVIIDDKEAQKVLVESYEYLVKYQGFTSEEADALIEVTVYYMSM
jgi:hypothetical protein